MLEKLLDYTVLSPINVVLPNHRTFGDLLQYI
jgi:hypothetical protein